ncbi:uncharacterized protein NECHADRAFT_87982 [Fusarium vanettenii 77-13-4]|uniref:NAD-dependent epimerase/dehydratase domain-containing protein n=1 Tax=Fusarium vanettenii (strain ATCC MYA-4622 / CBS 123669 / FGSC 9596 / NRRL 45880 / 77-13-4) TaxID=660122 RepID=C7ZJY8_FUSV7|nr:uncharacterized protein NECHADRAFT_87982 [Fusarium vanettenii 77-13-4]EEU35715.1 hypothetical protein NECHADRAFT_87982 [Fusarium vanettenii 77-13-4]
MTRTLLTGGSGFVAGHVIDVLLQRGHSIVATVRSQEKAQAIRAAHPSTPSEKLGFVVIPDIAASGAFQGLGSYGLEAVIHVASPVREKLPEEGHWGGTPNPNLQSFGYDVSRAEEILGLKWTPYEKTVVDSVKSLTMKQ